MQKHLFHQTNQLTTDPILQKSCSEFGFFDQNNNEKIDLKNAWFSSPLGFKRHDIIDHVAEALKNLKYDYVDGNTTSLSRQKLANKLHDLSNGYYSIFGLSGSDAIETAIYISYMYDSNRKIVLSLDTSYHGATMLTRGLGTRTNLDTANQNVVKVPNCEYQKFGANAEKIFVKGLEHKIKSAGAENIACFVIETCSWIAGLYSYSDNLWQTIRTICNQNNILLVVDDIAMCGGKNGKFFGVNLPVVQPDIVCLGKALTGGYFPLSATLISDSVFKKIQDQPFQYSYTYSASVAGIESALKYIDILEKENILTQVPSQIIKYQQMLDTFKSQGFIIDYRNYGTVFSIDLPTTVDSSKLLEQGLFGRIDGSRILLAFPILATDEFITKVQTSLTNFFNA